MTSPMQPEEPSSGSPVVSPTPLGFEGSSFAVSARTRNALAVAIAGVWVAAFVADVALSTFETSAYIHMTMLGLAAAIFGSGFVRGIK